MGFTVVYDATHANIESLPAGGVKAGYATGGGDVPWLPADWSKYPDAIHIDQTPADTPWDATADVDDMEKGAVTLAELAPRAKLRLAAFHNGTRPGQRTPVVYMSASQVTPVVNALIAGGVTSGVGLWVASWDLTEATAVADVLAAAGPFPIVGVQYQNAGAFDRSVFSTTWLANVSVKPKPASQPSPVVTPGSAGKALPAPPGSWEKGATVTGIGTDGNLWTSTYEFATGKWSAPAKAL